MRCSCPKAAISPDCEIHGHLADLPLDDQPAWVKRELMETKLEWRQL